jgi:SpoVK/Ycf46/Vps4 family AAA+-type ATPase
VAEIPANAPRQDRYGFIDWRMLPSAGWEQYWDRIFVPDSVKVRLYNYAQFALMKRENFSLVGLPIHGIGLLRGAPGTGKSSLVKGLAQKLATDTFDEVLFAEVNAHSLPSQMLGDSQRNTMNLLERALPELADKGFPVVVLIDEIDSVAVARDRASAGTDPVDVARATEAALNGLDRLAEQNKNLVIFGTSNFAEAIDHAFLSRIDLTVDFGLPDEATVAAIFNDVLSEVNTDIDDEQRAKLVGELVGLSGRDIRKIVFEAVVSRDSDNIGDPVVEHDITAVLDARRAL